MLLFHAVNDRPLAYRLRPRTLEDFVGQETIVGKGTALRKAIEEDRLTSVILAGPPGTGKTTLATIIAEMTNAAFVQLNAVISGVKELRAVCEQAEATHRNLKQRTILFIDEIHRFNRSQQDALLPFVESGTVILIGATTQNPYFDVNSALISRSQVYLLKPLTEEQLFSILQRALMHQEGFNSSVQIADAALKHIAQLSNGDARIAPESPRHDGSHRRGKSIAGESPSAPERTKQAVRSERRRSLRYDLRLH